MSEKFTPTPGDDFLRRANWDHKYRHQNMSVDMDVWYPMLKSITFKTYFIHIKYCEAEAIINFYNYRVKRQKNAFSVKDTKILIKHRRDISKYSLFSHNDFNESFQSNLWERRPKYFINISKAFFRHERLVKSWWQRANRFKKMG